MHLRYNLIAASKLLEGDFGEWQPHLVVQPMIWVKIRTESNFYNKSSKWDYRAELHACSITICSKIKCIWELEPFWLAKLGLFFYQEKCLLPIMFRAHQSRLAIPLITSVDAVFGLFCQSSWQENPLLPGYQTWEYLILSKLRKRS